MCLSSIGTAAQPTLCLVHLSHQHPAQPFPPPKKNHPIHPKLRLLTPRPFQGRFLDQVGCGAAGLLDGSYKEAAFYRPQGVAYSPKVCCQTQGRGPRACSSAMNAKRACLRTRRALHAALGRPLGSLGAAPGPGCSSASSLGCAPTHPLHALPPSPSPPPPLVRLQRDCLYVADTEAHALREIDLRRKTVTTLAGAPGSARHAPPSLYPACSGPPRACPC